MAQAISSKDNMQNVKRNYIRSSSFVMAALFTVLCGAAALCLGYFIFFFAKGHLVYATEAVLDSRIDLIKATSVPETGIHDDYIYSFLNEDHSLPDAIKVSVKRFSEGMLVLDGSENKKRYAAKIYSLGDGQKLLIGFDITDTSRNFKRMQIMGIASIVFVMLVAL